MSLLHTLYNTILDAVFPLSPFERELFSYSPELAYTKLPGAPTVPFGDAHSIFAYKDERVAKLIWNIKYKKSAQAVQIGGYALYRRIQDFPRPTLEDTVILIPMPITSRRRRERGFNQCELLTDEIGRLDEHKRFIVRSDLLIRTQHMSRQTLKGRAERLEDAKGIFSVNEKVLTEIRDKNNGILPTLVVIDDVITTGSTIKEAMETLRKAGFENVRGISLAH
jgi:ComF family protein